jgi:hypothetical protein
VTCCAERPKRYISKEVFEIPELQQRLQKIEDSNHTKTYRCSECRQIWHEEWVPVMHAATTVVYKDGVNPDPLVDIDNPPREWVLPPTPPPRSGCAGQVLVVALAMTIGLATLPEGDRAARASWNQAFLFAGVTGALVYGWWAQRRR